MRTLSIGPCTVALVFAVLLLSACEESVDPILDSDRQFTLFATLDMNADTQFVRVIPIREALIAPNPDAPLAATVTSTDLTSGETVTWRDSTVRFANGGVGHVFYAPLRVRPERTYRIDVKPNDGDLVTHAQTTIPRLPRPRVLPESVESVTTPTGAQVRATQQILWDDITREPFDLTYWYRFLSIGQYTFSDVLIPYTPRILPSENQPGTWVVNVNLQADRAGMDSLIDLSDKALAGLGMTLTILDDAFTPPGGRFDLDVLSQPGTFSNVENGFGFVGSVGRFSVEWLLDEASVRTLRYRPLTAFKGGLPPEVRAHLPQRPARARPRHHPGF